MPEPIAPFAPALSELGLEIFERIGMQAGALNVTHLNSLRRAMNLVLVRWTAYGINRWRVAPVTVPLLPRVATYPVDAATIDVLDAYVRTTFGGISTDIIITSMSENTFAALPRKDQPGRPVLFWYQRLLQPTITVWPVPDTLTYSLNYYAFTQISDADPAGGNTGNIPYRFLEAFTAGVAANMAIKWAPERFAPLDAYAKETFTEASDGDAEAVTLTLAPNLEAYFH